MNSKMTELAREAVACDGWRWMEGMAVYPDGYREGDESIRLGCEAYTPSGFWFGMYSGNETTIDPDIENSIPDLTDPATLGCLLHLVREVYDDLSHNAIYSDPKQHGLSGHPSWVVVNDVGDRFSDELPTEAHALVAALKAGGDQ